jgi:micrococcal nuclease
VIIDVDRRHVTVALDCDHVNTRFAAGCLVLVLASTSVACAAGQEKQSQDSCTVMHVSDGDSFRCSDGRRVRLTGIDSPEFQQQPFGAQARKALSALLPVGTIVRLERDAAPNDQYGRVLAYVWAGSALVNEAMLRDGWALLYTVPPNVKYVDRLEHAQKEARARSAGLWGEPGFDCRPSDFRRNRCVSSP